MLITRHIERDIGPPPTQEELIKLWNLMVDAQDDEYEYLAPAKRLVSGRDKATEALRRKENE